MRPREAFKEWDGYGCVPRRMHPAWQRVSYLARALGRDLMSLVDDFATMRIRTSGDWKSSLCLSLCVNGRNDRRNAKHALDALVEAGLLTVEDGSVTVNVQPRCTHGALTVQSSSHSGVFNSTQVPENTQVENDSKSVSQEVSERAPARETRDVGKERPETSGFRFVASLLDRTEFDISPVGAYARQYAWIGHRPEAERKAVRKAVEADTWCQLNPHKVDAPHLERRWQHYLGGETKPVIKPVIAATAPRYRDLSRAAGEGR